MQYQGERWWRERDLNSRLHDYETCDDTNKNNSKQYFMIN